MHYRAVGRSWWPVLIVIVAVAVVVAAIYLLYLAP